MTPNACKYDDHKRHEAFSCRYENTAKVYGVSDVAFFSGISCNVTFKKKYAAWSTYFYVFSVIWKVNE